MKLRTTFWGADVLFEGDLSLALRAIPAGARGTCALVTPAPAQGIGPDEIFHELFPIANGQGSFGLAVQADSSAAIIDLSARRVVEQVAATGFAANARAQIDLGGIWMRLDNTGSPALPDTPDDRLNFTTVV